MQSWPLIIWTLLMYSMFGFAVHFTWKAIFDPEYISGDRSWCKTAPEYYGFVAFIGFGWFASSAIYSALFWMPDWMGWAGDDGWTSLRSGVAAVSGMVIGAAMTWVVYELARHKIEIEELRREETTADRT